MEKQKVRLGEILDNFDRLRKPLSSMQREKFKGNYPYYGAQGIIDYVADYRCDGEYLLIAEDGENLSSRNAPIAQIARGQFWVNNHAHIVKNNDKSDIRYVCYLINSSDIAGYVTGAAQPKLSQANLNKIVVEIHNIEVQHRIASILSTYDTLIENNTKRIRLLEKMAENLYKEWFVRFRFPGHENVEMENGLPKGWKYYRIEDLCDINRETIKIANAPKDILYLDTGSVTRGKISDVESLAFADAPSRARRIVRNNSIIYSTVRPNLQHYGILKNPPSNLLVSTGFAVLDSKEEIANIVYLALSHPSVYRYCSLIADCAVATYPSIKPKEIGRIYIALPKLSVCKRWNEKIENFYKMINKLQNQNSLLARQRDLLLPRLMSGKLEVKVKA